MSTITQRRPRVKPKRSIRLAVAPCHGNPGVVWITVGKAGTEYLVYRQVSDFGTGFKLVKLTGEPGVVYHVNLSGGHSTCECKGFLAHGHCKHIDGCRALQNAGQL